MPRSGTANPARQDPDLVLRPDLVIQLSVTAVANPGSVIAKPKIQAASEDDRSMCRAPKDTQRGRQLTMNMRRFVIFNVALIQTPFLRTTQCYDDR